MTTREAVVARAVAANGYLDGAGYDIANRYSAQLHLPAEAWCGDFVTGVFLEAGLPLPSMQVGHPQGFSYCPSAVQFGRAHSIVVPSWEAEPGDIALFDWNGDGIADHTELVEQWVSGVLHTIGGNSGPSNVDNYRGAGGVHRHIWTAPTGRGNNQVLAVLNSSRLVAFTAAAVEVPAFPGRPLVLKSPNLSGNDVRTWQQQMHTRGWSITVDGIYGPASRDTCLKFQSEKRLAVDGIVGPVTWAASWSAPVT